SQYCVVLEVHPQFAMGPKALKGIFVRTRGGRPVPLSSIASVRERPTTLLISHIGQFPAVTVSFNLGPRASLGDAVSAIERAARELGLPEAVEMQFEGAAHAF